MSLNDNLAIHEEDAQRINGVLLHFLGESGANESLLIDRSGQLGATVGDHPSGTTVAGGLVRSTRELGRAALERSREGRSPRHLLDLAPGGVYRAVPVTRNAGGLLHHRFTLTAAAEAAAAVCSLWHCPAGHPGWVLPTTSPCGARTFLDGSPRRGRPADSSAECRRPGSRQARPAGARVSTGSTSRGQSSKRTRAGATSASASRTCTSRAERQLLPTTDARLHRGLLDDDVACAGRRSSTCTTTPANVSPTCGASTAASTRSSTARS